MTVLRTICTVVWGVVSDKTRARKKVYLVTRFLSMATLLLLAIPAVATGFYPILAVSAVQVHPAAFVSQGILDSYTLDALGTRERKRYGAIRMFSAISWGLGSVLMGLVADRFGFDYNFALFGALGLFGLVLTAVYVPDRTATQEETGKGEARSTDLFAVLSRGRVIFFFCEMLVFGAGIATVERLLFLFLINDLKASTFLCGLTVGVTVILELPIFIYAAPLLRLVTRDGMFLVSLVAYAARVYGYTLLTPDTASYILALESLHGITFACMWVTAMDVAKQISPKGWETTMPTLVQSVYGCLGQGLGSVVGGWVMENYGSKVMYRWASFIVSGVFVLHLVVMVGVQCVCSVPRRGGGGSRGQGRSWGLLPADDCLPAA